MTPLLCPALTGEQIGFLSEGIRNQTKGFLLTNCISFEDLSRFMLVLRNNSETLRIFFCLQKPFLRFHFLTQMIEESQSRHPLASFFLDNRSGEPEYEITDAGCRITEGRPDRILFMELTGKRKKLHFIVEFFPKYPNYYLTDEENTILFSLHPIQSGKYSPPVSSGFSPREPSPLLSHAETERKYFSAEQTFLFEHDKERIKKSIQGAIKRCTKRLKHEEEELNRCRSGEQIEHEGELLKANFFLLRKGQQEVSVWDYRDEKEIRIVLDPLLSPKEQIESCFRKSKKLKRGSPYAKERQEKTRALLTSLQGELADLERITSREELSNVLKTKSGSAGSKAPKEKPKKRLPYLEFISAAGTKIWVGKSAKDNEALTFSLSRGSDWWLHVQNYPGSHIIIRTAKGQEPDRETLADALQLALHYSKAKQQGEAEVCITQRKFVSRYGRNNPGKVQIAKSKLHFVKQAPERYRKLKERHVEDD